MAYISRPHRRWGVAGLLVASGHHSVVSPRLVAVIVADRLVDRTPYVGSFLTYRAEGAAEKAANVTSDGVELALEQEVTTVK